MKLRRDVAALPVRSGEEVWATIVDLLVAHDSNDSDQLSKAAPIMSALLSEDYYSEHPLTVVGDSHRLVIYMSYGVDALTADVDVTPLGWNPTAGDWNVFVPCAAEHRTWASRMFAECSPRIIAIGLDDDISEVQDSLSAGGQKGTAFDVDWSRA